MQSKYKYFLLIPIIVSFIYVINWYFTPKFAKYSNSGILPKSVDINSRLNYLSVRNELIKNGCLEVDLCVKLLRLESNNFQSRFAREYNNISGMRLQPFETHNIGVDENLFLIYSDWRLCVKDFATWQSYALSKNSGVVDDWCIYFEKNYAQSKGYCDALKNFN